MIPPHRIIFIGPGGVGKTTLGRQVAELIGHPSYDLDEMFCEQIMNVRRFIQVNGYASYSQTNGNLLRAFLCNPPSRMILSLSSGVLSEDMAQPMRRELLSTVRRTGDAFLIIPHPDNEMASRLVATRQIGRGFGLRFEPERKKYLRRITEYRQLGFPEIRGGSHAALDAQAALDQMAAIRRYAG